MNQEELDKLADQYEKNIRNRNRVIVITLSVFVMITSPFLNVLCKQILPPWASEQVFGDVTAIGLTFTLAFIISFFCAMMSFLCHEA